MSLVQLIADGTITVEELENAPECILRAKLVVDGIEACKKTLLFPWGVEELDCYHYTDSAGEYSAWGKFSRKGILTLYCNWGGNHEIGRVDFNKSANVFLAFEKSDLQHDLERFLKERIAMANRQLRA